MSKREVWVVEGSLSGESKWICEAVSVRAYAFARCRTYNTQFKPAKFVATRYVPAPAPKKARARK